MGSNVEAQFRKPYLSIEPTTLDDSLKYRDLLLTAIGHLLLTHTPETKTLDIDQASPKKKITKHDPSTDLGEAPKIPSVSNPSAWTTTSSGLSVPRSSSPPPNPDPTQITTKPLGAPTRPFSYLGTPDSINPQTLDTTDPYFEPVNQKLRQLGESTLNHDHEHVHYLHAITGEPLAALSGDSDRVTVNGLTPVADANPVFSFHNHPSSIDHQYGTHSLPTFSPSDINTAMAHNILQSSVRDAHTGDWFHLQPGHGGWLGNLGPLINDGTLPPDFGPEDIDDFYHGIAGQTLQQLAPLVRQGVISREEASDMSSHNAVAAMAQLFGWHYRREYHTGREQPTASGFIRYPNGPPELERLRQQRQQERTNYGFIQPPRPPRKLPKSKRRR
jgi:hypothetical protein